uniref:Uncharacterized protein n=1 Tax=Arundo donax TaxID=35708 RepID=A0A0A9E5F2_ARUDO
MINFISNAIEQFSKPTTIAVLTKYVVHCSINYANINRNSSISPLLSLRVICTACQY